MSDQPKDERSELESETAAENTAPESSVEETDAGAQGESPAPADAEPTAEAPAETSPEGSKSDASADAPEESGEPTSSEPVFSEPTSSEPVAESSEPASDASEGDTPEGEVGDSEEEPAKPVKRYEVSSGPLELIEEAEEVEDELKKDWYILKVMVNRENTIAEALKRKIAINGMEKYFGEIVVPVEEVTEYDKNGKKKTRKKRLYPGYIMVNMAITDESWFVIRETAGIGDFTGSAGKPAPMLAEEVEKIIKRPKPEAETEEVVDIPYKKGDHVRVKEGNFENFDGVVESVDPKNGRCKLLVEIFGRSVEVDIEYWNIEPVG